MKALLFSAVCLFCLQSFSQNLPLDPAIKTGKLANGFTYYIRKNTEPANRVQLYLVNKVGSVLESDDQRGLAHFMEHMSFNGTTHYPKNKLVQYLQKSGVRFGADLNAYTSFDETVYQLPLPTDDPVLLQNGLQIMRDWAGNALLDSKEIDAERGVVLEEKRLGKGAQERMSEKTLPVILNGSRYAIRLPIGTDTVLKHFNRETILSFYKDWYRPDLQALIVVGDINVDSIEKQIRKLFSDLKNPANERERTKYRVALTGKNQFLTVTDKEFPYTLIQVYVKRKSMEQGSLEEYKEYVKRNIFNQMLSERLAELSQKPNSPFIQAFANVGNFLGGLDAFNLFILVKPGQLKPSFVSVWELIQQARQFGFTKPEFDRAKLTLISSLESAVKEKDKRNSQDLVQEYTRNFLENEPAPGIEKEYELTKGFLDTVKLADINRLGPVLLSDSNRDVVIMAPQKDSALLPVEASVNSWFDIVAKTKITPYADQFSNQALVSDNLRGSKIVDERKLPKLGVTELLLANGVKIILKPTDFKNEEIRFQAFSPGGTSLYADSVFQSASNADNVISSMGIGKFNPTDLGKVLSGKNLGVSPYIAERSEGISGSSTPKDLETALQLIYLYFTSPRIDTALFNNMIEQSISAMENRNDEPNSVFSDTVAAVLGSYNVRRTGPTVEKLKQIKLNQSVQIYKERFGNAGDFTFVFDGNFRIDSLKPLLEKYLGSLPSTKQKEQAKDLHLHIPAGRIDATAVKGKEDKATVRLVISGDYTYSAESNMQLNALKEILEFHLLDRLREKEGGVYSPNVRLTYNKFPSNRYAYTISFGCAPGNVDKLIAATQEEIANLKKQGPDNQDITKFYTEETRQYELQLKDNGFWLDWLAQQYQNGDDPQSILDYPVLVSQVTIASVKTAASQYLNERNFIKLLLLPE